MTGLEPLAGRGGPLAGFKAPFAFAGRYLTEGQDAPWRTGFWRAAQSFRPVRLKPVAGALVKDDGLGRACSVFLTRSVRGSRAFRSKKLALLPVPYRPAGVRWCDQRASRYRRAWLKCPSLFTNGCWTKERPFLVALGSDGRLAKWAAPDVTGWATPNPRMIDAVGPLAALVGERPRHDVW
jgi:hypothetical protein